mmetsp:Transcript_83057/g.267661  ORF Transcript_83057/g.267661 Transcript_83057/m.267661 type:complete len:234 (+) Transcript_83057:730-1431(+)
MLLEAGAGPRQGRGQGPLSGLRRGAAGHQRTELRALTGALRDGDLHPLHSPGHEEGRQIVGDKDLPPKVLGKFLCRRVDDREHCTILLRQHHNGAAFATDLELAAVRLRAADLQNVALHRHQRSLIQRVASFPCNLLEVAKIRQVAIGLDGGAARAHADRVVVPVQRLPESFEGDKVRRRELQVVQRHEDLAGSIPGHAVAFQRECDPAGHRLNKNNRLGKCALGSAEVPWDT